MPFILACYLSSLQNLPTTITRIASFTIPTKRLAFRTIALVWNQNLHHKLCLSMTFSRIGQESLEGHKLHFTFSSFAWALEALHTLVVVFADRNPSWRCVTNANPAHSSGHSVPILCVDSMPMSSICSMDRSLWEWTHGKSESTVSEWDLICENSYKKGLAQSSFFIGCLIGNQTK